MSRSYPIVVSTKIDIDNDAKSKKNSEENVVKDNDIADEKKQQKSKNKSSKKQDIMTTDDNKFDLAQEIVQELKPETKVLKKDKGIIERTESSKIILTEDNKQILND